MIRVLVLSEYILLREGLSRLIRDAKGGTEVVDASDAEEVAKSFHTARPDVVLLHATETSSRLSQMRLLHEYDPGLPIVLLLDDPSDDAILGVLQAGAAGCLDRSVGASSLMHALEDAADGEISLSPVFARRLARMVGTTNGRGRNGRARLDGLTDRELEVLSLLAQGMTNREIGSSLFVSESTIRAHLRTVTQKLGVQNRVHAVARALELGIVTLPSTEAPPKESSGKRRVAELGAGGLGLLGSLALLVAPSLMTMAV